MTPSLPPLNLSTSTSSRAGEIGGNVFTAGSFGSPTVSGGWIPALVVGAAVWFLMRK